MTELEDLKAIRKAINQITDDLNKDGLLKDAKSTLKLVLWNTKSLPLGIKVSLQDTASIRTKTLYVQALGHIKENIIKTYFKDLKATKPTKATASPKPTKPIKDT